MRLHLCIAALLLAAEPSAVVGVWRGESICATSASACHNEHVVYYIKDVPDHPDTVYVQADKIVDGRALAMGEGEWRLDRAQHTIEFRMPNQVWLLKFDGDRLEGKLTLADGTIFRNATLRKDH